MCVQQALKAFMRETAKLSALILSTTMLCLFYLHAPKPVQGTEIPSEGEVLRSSLAGLKQDNVYLSVETDMTHHNTIGTRVLRLLDAGGLKLRTGWSYQQRQPLLKLTLRTETLKDCESEKVLYFQKLEFFEHVALERSRLMKTWTATWTYGFIDPIVIDRISLERLEKDADHLIKDFIQDYRYANQ